MMKRIQFGPIDLYGCHDALLRLDDFIDQELSPLETRKVRTHLRICRHCAPKFLFEASLSTGLQKRIKTIEVPETLVYRLHKAIEQAHPGGEENGLNT